MNGQNAAAALAVGRMLLSSTEAVADPPSGSEAAQRTGLPTTEIPPVNSMKAPATARHTTRVASRASRSYVATGIPAGLGGGPGSPNE